MIYYVDASVLVSALTAERRTTEMQQWLADRSIDGITVSDWTETEVAAALSVKSRTGLLPVDEQRLALDQFGEWLADVFDVLPVRRADFRAAAKLASRARLGLRAGDALHLAIAQAAGLELVTVDVKLAEASRDLGIATLLL